MTESPGRQPIGPPRVGGVGAVRGVLWVAAVLLVFVCLYGAGASPQEFARGAPSLGRLLASMWPPDFSRFGSIGAALLVTLQIAIAGTALGLAMAAPLSALAWRGLGVGSAVRHAVRTLLSAFRTAPELLWALVFVVAVGPGPFAGVLAIAADTVGFAGRYFAAALDEADPGPQEALRVHGASRPLVLVAATVPLAFPALLHTALFSLERAVRASVVLGVVGAGGIGIELKVAMDLFQYRRAAAMILCVLAVVVAVEALSSVLRRALGVQRPAGASE